MGYVFFVIFTVLALLMIPFSAEAASAAAQGLKVFALDMLPTLFPFMVCAGFITKKKCLGDWLSAPAQMFSLETFVSVCYNRRNPAPDGCAGSRGNLPDGTCAVRGIT